MPKKKVEPKKKVVSGEKSDLLKKLKLGENKNNLKVDVATVISSTDAKSKQLLRDLEKDGSVLHVGGNMWKIV